MTITSLPQLLSGTYFQGQHAVYKSVYELRRGGMGVVFLAQVVDDLEEDTESNQRQVVLKMSLRVDEHACARMDQEITALQALQHDQVVSVIDRGQQAGHSWYAMEYVGPCNLGDILLVRKQGVPSDLPSIVVGIIDGELEVIPRAQRIGLPISTAVTLIGQVAETVAHAHHRGVLHRDLKPANILLDDSGAPVLCDFGVARAQGYDFNLTAIDEVVGTLDYIAPEQLAGAKTDERSDVYAIGAMLYETLTGQLPPRRENGWDPLPGLHAMPKPLQAIVRYALHPNPKKRIATAGALAADLQRFHEGQSVLAPHIKWYVLPALTAYRRPMISGFVVMTLLLTILIGWAIIDQQRQETVHWEAPVAHIVEGTFNRESFSIGHSSWAQAPHGQAGISSGYPIFNKKVQESHHIALGFVLPRRSGQRLVVEVDTNDGDQEISLFLAPRADDWQGGYTLQIGAYDNTCAILGRGNDRLWIGDHRVVPNQRMQIVLERSGEIIRAEINGETIIEQQDTLPFSAQSGGVFTYLFGKREYTNPPAYKQISTQMASLPKRVEADWLLGIYAITAEMLSSQERRSFGQAAMIQGDALTMGLADNDPRKASMYLRKEKLREFAGLPLRGARDLSVYSRWLGHQADFYLHQMSVHKDNISSLREIMVAAKNYLNEDETSRFISAISHNLPAAARAQLHQELYLFAENDPIIQDYILSRYLGTFPNWVKDFGLYWATNKTLAQRDTGSYWSLQSKKLDAQFETWQKIRKGSSPFNEWRQENPLQRDGTKGVGVFWGETWPYGIRKHEQTDAVEALLFLNNHTPLPKQLEGTLTVIYKRPDWGQYRELFYGGHNASLSAITRNLYVRHFAVAMLLAPDKSELHLALPYFIRDNSPILVELVVAGVASGEYPFSVLSPFDNLDAPVIHMLRWIVDQGSLDSMPSQISLTAALGPVLHLAQAKRLQDMGEHEMAKLVLEELAQDREWLPTTQAAHAISRWGWP